ncbi:hypothetical protein Tco_1163384 [Tanacetum coccineum]
MYFHNSKLHMAYVEEEFSGMPALNGFSHFDPYVADESPYTMPSVRADLSGIATFIGLSDFNPHIVQWSPYMPEITNMNLYYAKTVAYTVWANQCESYDIIWCVKKKFITIPVQEKGRDGRRASHAFKEIWEVGTKRRQAAIVKKMGHTVNTCTTLHFVVVPVVVSILMELLLSLQVTSTAYQKVVT